jgi:hypothetical protein
MTATLIGTLHETRLTCGSRHLPGCYNPGTQETYCICGKKRWAGQVGTWHSRQRREPTTYPETGRPNEDAVIGWDTYFLHAADCPERERCGRQSHICKATA